MRSAVLLLLAGCGRIAFDAQPGTDATDSPGAFGCVTVGTHDEDGDGVLDACDTCPHVAVSQLDSDGDGVGDACDPHPTEPRDHIAMFDPFTSVRPEWTFRGGMPLPYSYGPDELIFDGFSGQYFEAALQDTPPANDTYLVGAQVSAGIAGGSQHQFVMGLGPIAGASSFYCDLNGDDTTAAFWAETYTLDGTSYQSTVGGAAVGPIENGAFTMSAQLEADVWICDTTWPADMPHLQSTKPAGIPIEQYGIGMKGVDVKLFYFLHIHSD